MPFIFTYKKVITTYILFALALSLSPMGIAHAVVNITQVTPVQSNTNDNTPTYIFNADGVGNIIYGPGCISSVYTTSVLGLNTVEFDSMPDNTYSTCTISVNDGTPGNILNIPTFIVDTLAPMVTPNGGSVTMPINGTYSEQGAQWNDTPNGNGIITAGETTTNLNTAVAGSYTVTYTHVDAAGNTGTATRTVTVNAGAIPVITLSGSAIINLNVGDSYVDSGATANDTEDGDRTAFIVTVNPVNTSIPGSYTITYNVTDSNGNNANQVIRTVNVNNANTPAVTRLGQAIVSVEQGTVYIDAGATAFDPQDGIITASIVVNSGGLNTNVAGTYVITYDVTDSNNNPAPTVSRTVTVSDTTSPMVSLIGSPMVDVLLGQTYTDLGASWTDIADGSGVVMGTGIVNTGSVGTYVLSYGYTDNAGNTGSMITRTINVIAGDVPVMVLNGSGTMTLPLGGTYSELGATATDTEDGTLTGITISGSVDVNSVGSYTISYSITDSNLNTMTINRTVNIIDPIAPVVTLNGSGSITMNAGTSFVDPGASWTDNVDGSGVVMGVGTFNPNLAGTYTLSYNYTDVGGNLGTAVTRTITVVGSVVTPSGAGPGGGGGSAYAGVNNTTGLILNSAPEFNSPADDLVPYIVRILRTASRESRIAMNSASTLELKNPITEYICTDLNKYISQNDAYLSNIHEDEYTDAIKSLMMYRPYDNEDQITDFSQRYLANKPFGIIKYNEFYNGTQDITRAEFVKMLVRALSCHYVSSNTESMYTDVGENAWYTEYINFATENGWIDGYEDGTFRPHDPITRADAVRAIALAIQLDVPDIFESEFVDVSSTNEYAPYIYAMNELGVIAPQNDYIFGLNGNISRNDIAKIFHTIFLNVDE